MVENVHITNFKSIKDVHLNDCRRINLFIGKPNVGKSNILEALSLFSLPYLQYAKEKHIRQFIRVESDSELFFDGDMDKSIEVETNGSTSSINVAKILVDDNKLLVDLTFKQDGESERVLRLPFNNLILSTKKISENYGLNPFKSYFYTMTSEKRVSPEHFLSPPSGSNLMDIVSHSPRLKQELANKFDEYGLKYFFDTNSREIRAFKEKGQGEIFSIPFYSMADSLQRLIFYKTAIESNQNSILIFEEPEAHAYPPYISNVVQEIIYSKNNQFFITTHSPYVVSELLESAEKELAIYLVDYKDGQTVVKRLDDEELQEIYEYGVDLFFNTETFLQS
ncbi:DNA replication and repair protein RecF [termite gut metagenome]|uniref:DNA replication and repair protein RecF n=1 Tax=termite gut metagenome TaxID=433724 RepID=A0A5J4STY2_9ZZZZ